MSPSGCITAPDSDVKTSYQTYKLPWFAIIRCEKEVLCRVGL